MAKSLRSKWKRKMKAIKRERYAVKELKMLKEIVARAEEVKVVSSTTASLQEQQPSSSSSDSTRKNQKSEEDVKMEDVEEPKRDSKTLRDENGHYPVWLNGRKMKKHKQKLKRIQKKSRK